MRTQRNTINVAPDVHRALAKLARQTGAPMGLVLEALVSVATAEGVQRIIRERAEQ